MNEAVGIKLKELRKKKGMTQEQVADFLQMSQSAYARMEAGKGNSWVRHLKKISEIFNVSAEEVLSSKKNEKEENANYNLISKKLIIQYEERIRELTQIIKVLKEEKEV